MSAVAETVYQAGIESTPGTAVAATRKIYSVAPLPVEDENIEQVSQARDNYVANFDTLQTHRSASWANEEVFNFQEMAFWSECALEGGVSPTGAGPYTRVYDNMPSTDTLKSLTLEAADNVAAWEVPHLLIKDWEISGADGNGPKPVIFKANWMGAQKVATTITPALSDRDISGSYGLFRNVALYLDDTAGAIGTTEVAALMAFSIKCDHKLQANFPGNAGGIYTTTNREKRAVEITLDLLLNSTTLTEFNDHFVDGDPRFGQLNIQGSGNDDFKFNFAVKRWNKFEPSASGPTRRVVLMAQCAYDVTLGYDWQATLINDVASIS